MNEHTNNMRCMLVLSLASALLLSSAVFAQAVQNTTTSFVYDVMGNPTVITLPLGRVTNQTFDVLNRKKTEQLPFTNGARPTVAYFYDGLDQFTNVTDPLNLTTNYGVDGLANATTLGSPDTGASSRTHDAEGNVLTSTDARGKTTSFTYDGLGRLKSKTYASGVASVFEYDGGPAGPVVAIGKMSKFTDESGSTSYEFAGLGRLTRKVQVTGAVTLVVAYTYGTEGSATGKLTSVAYPSGNRVNYAYDDHGQVAAITVNRMLPGSTLDATATPLLTNIAYSPFGLARSWNWGNHSEAAPNLYARVFDLDGRLTRYPLGTGTVRTLAYDAGSRIVTMTHTGELTSAGGDQGFEYDPLDRLTKFTGNNSTEQYAYDRNGNRTQLVLGATSYGYTIAGGSNRLGSTTGPLPAKVNTFDPAGNLTNDGAAGFTYSDRGRLKSVLKAGVVTNYLYNAIDQRVTKAGTGVETGAIHYAYDENGRLLGEYKADGAAIQETVYLGDQPVAVLNGEVLYVYADQIATPRVIARASDNGIIWRWDRADPFGAQAPIVADGANGFVYNPRFPGQVFDRETNLHYNYFRDYDPQTGRYVQSDPIGLRGGINTYAYVVGNPLSAVDPFGLEVIYKKDGVEFHGNPMPKGGTNYGEHTTQVDGKTAYHVHINDDPNKRWDVTNNKALDPEGNFTKKELKVCKSLNSNETKYLSKAAREVFHHRPERLPKIRARYLTFAGTIFGALMSNSYEETCNADVRNDLGDVCE